MRGKFVTNFPMMYRSRSMYTIPFCMYLAGKNLIVYHYKLCVLVYAPVRKITPEVLLGQLHEVAVGQDHPQPDRGVLCLGDLERFDEFQAHGPDGHGRQDAEGRRGLALTEEGRELGCCERCGRCGVAIMNPDVWESRS